MGSAPRTESVDGAEGRTEKRIPRRVAARRWTRRSTRIAIRMMRISMNAEFHRGYAAGHTTGCDTCHATGHAMGYTQGYQHALNAMHCWTVAHCHDWETAYDKLGGHVRILEGWRDQPGRPADPPLACHDIPGTMGRRATCGLRHGRASCCP